MDATPAPAPPPARSRRRIAVAAAAVAVFAAGGVTYLATRSDPPRHRTVAAPTTPVSATSSTPTPTPSPTPTRPTVPHQYVAKAAPTSFVFRAPRFTIKAHVCGMANVRPLDPPGEQHHTVCWVQQDFGVAPGSNSATTYVLGHAWAQDRLEVLNKISEPATREILRGKSHTAAGGVPIWPVKSLVGSSIVLRTKTGVLTYRVRTIFGVHKNQAGFVRGLMNEKVRNRIVILTCAELNGVDYEYNVVVYAYLHSSVRTRAAA